MAPSLQPIRYQSVHTASLVAENSNDEFAGHVRDFLGRKEATEPVNVEIARNGTCGWWVAGCGSLRCFGETPERAKAGLAQTLRKIAAELDEARLG